MEKTQVQVSSEDHLRLTENRKDQLQEELKGSNVVNNR